MIEDPEFRANATKRDADLASFRDRIRAGEMPPELRDALGSIQSAFPAGTSIRCRSSTNNEDLPGFSGAGLYDSFTHHPDEGHLAATIRQVFAGAWNFRAYEEREFFRIDHFATAMGVLLHPNYADEAANGVAVTTDPLYQSQGFYYVNAQLGEDLVTNPEGESVPEELLLDWWSARRDRSLRASNRTADGAAILTGAHREALRSLLGKIHGKFAKLYGAGLDDESFAMEIEFKVTRDGIVAVKQARPWLR